MKPVAAPRTIALPVFKERRGSLSFGEVGRQLPFSPKRYFVVYGVPGNTARGGHSHKRSHQFLVCVKGACSVFLDDGKQRRTVRLKSPRQGLYIPPGVWGVQNRYTPDAVLLVLASHTYDPADYIRDYAAFLKAAQP